MSKPKKQYEVGYGRPPAEHRFKRGESGNPAGRPKGRKNFRTLVQNLANREMDVTMGSKRTTITTGEALLHALTKSALSGNTRALAVAVTLLQTHLIDDAADTARDPHLVDQEREIVNQILAKRGGSNDEPTG